MVARSGSSCAVKLAGTGSTVQVFGATIALEEARTGEATVRVGNRTVSCRQGETVSVGPVRMACTDITNGVVSFTVAPR